MRNRQDIELVTYSSSRHILRFGRQQWLVLGAKVVAVLAEEVFFADEPHSRSAMAQINEFHRDTSHVRVPAVDFDYYVASSAIRGLRPLLGRSPSETLTETEK